MVATYIPTDYHTYLAKIREVFSDQDRNVILIIDNAPSHIVNDMQLTSVKV